jgi:hypothetical protein
VAAPSSRRHDGDDLTERPFPPARPQCHPPGRSARTRRRRRARSGRRGHTRDRGGERGVDRPLHHAGQRGSRQRPHRHSRVARERGRGCAAWTRACTRTATGSQAPQLGARLSRRGGGGPGSSAAPTSEPPASPRSGSTQPVANVSRPAPASATISTSTPLAGGSPPPVVTLPAPTLPSLPTPAIPSLPAPPAPSPPEPVTPSVQVPAGRPPAAQVGVSVGASGQTETLAVTVGSAERGGSTFPPYGILDRSGRGAAW